MKEIGLPLAYVGLAWVALNIACFAALAWRRRHIRED